MTGIGRYVRDAIISVAEVRPDWELCLICVAEQEGCDRAQSAFADAPGNVELTQVVRRPAVITRRFATRFGRPVLESWVGSVDAFVDSEWFRPAQRYGRRLTVVHDLIPYRYPEWVDARTRQAHLRAMRSVSTRVDRIMVNSHATARDLAAYVGVPEERCTVVYPSVDETFRQAVGAAPAVVASRPYAIAVGTVTRRKNLELAIRSLSFCDPELALVVVGASADADADIVRLAEVCGVADRVHRLGYVSDVELASFMAAASCLIFPSRFEGFGLPVIEAMSAGVPVVASADVSLDEACGDAAVRVDPDDPQALAAAVASIDRSRMVALGHQHALQFTRERMGEAVAVALESA